jgi:hypothetical protein
MNVSIAWWQLDESEQTIESLREYLRDEGVQPWYAVPGLCLKLWVADPGTNCWGAVMVWESAQDAKAPLPPNKAAELIGYPPTHRISFDVEASAVGQHSLDTLAGLGPAGDTAGHVRSTA